MNIRDYEDEFLDDESFETVKGPRKFRVPKEGGKHRDRQRNKQEIRKKKERLLLNQTNGTMNENSR